VVGKRRDNTESVWIGWIRKKSAADEKRVETDVRRVVKTVEGMSGWRLSPNFSFPRGDEKKGGKSRSRRVSGVQEELRSTSVDDNTFSKGGGVRGGLRSEGYTPFEKSDNSREDIGTYDDLGADLCRAYPIKTKPIRESPDQRPLGSEVSDDEISHDKGLVRGDVVSVMT